jgi:hypothetical protein
MMILSNSIPSFAQEGHGLKSEAKMPAVATRRSLRPEGTEAILASGFNPWREEENGN